MPAVSPNRHVALYERVLGTSMELQAIGGDGPRAEAAALAEIDRLEAVLSRFRRESELSRWQATFDEDVPVSQDLAEVLRAAEAWRARTGGAFDPTVSGEGAPRWTVGEGTARRLTRKAASLDALAKGHIVDRAAEAAAAHADAVLLNVGGDLRHLGDRPVRVAIADPFAPHENAAPIARVGVCGQGVATSGAYRRGAHLVDPRTGRPATHVASATVVAPTAAEADVLATACFVLPPRAGLALADRLGVALLLVLPNGKSRANRAWRRLP